MSPASQRGSCHRPPPPAIGQWTHRVRIALNQRCTSARGEERATPSWSSAVMLMPGPPGADAAARASARSFEPGSPSARQGPPTTCRSRPRRQPPRRTGAEGVFKADADRSRSCQAASDALLWLLISEPVAADLAALTPASVIAASEDWPETPRDGC